jgi:hypothetical protein
MRCYCVCQKNQPATCRCIECETIEDAIRAYNGTATNFSRDQLDIIEMTPEIMVKATPMVERVAKAEEERRERVSEPAGPPPVDEDEERRRFGRVLTKNERKAVAEGRPSAPHPLQ